MKPRKEKGPWATLPTGTSTRLFPPHISTAFYTKIRNSNHLQ